MIKEKLLLFLQEGRIEAGCDEAGRGCLAGPVFAAAVILPANFENELLNDSKKLTENNGMHSGRSLKVRPWLSRLGLLITMKLTGSTF